MLHFGDMIRGITTCVTTCSLLTLHSSSRRSSRPSWPSMSAMHGWLSLNSIRFQGSSSRRYSSCSNWNTCWQGHTTYLKLNLMNKVESTSQLVAREVLKNSSRHLYSFTSVEKCFKSRFARQKYKKTQVRRQRNPSPDIWKLTLLNCCWSFSLA